VVLHEAVQRGLFRAVAFAADRGAIQRPLGLPGVGYPADQLEGQLSGAEIALRTGASRPISDIRRTERVAPKWPVEATCKLPAQYAPM
jgi:hypothetical protein